MMSTLEGSGERFPQAPSRSDRSARAVQAFLDSCPATEHVTLVLDELATSRVGFTGAMHWVPG